MRDGSGSYVRGCWILENSVLFVWRILYIGIWSLEFLKSISWNNLFQGANTIFMASICNIKCGFELFNIWRCVFSQGRRLFSKGKFLLRNGALSRWLRKARYSMGLENFSWSGDRPFSHFHKTGCEQDWYGFVAFASCHNVLTEKFLYTFTNNSVR